MSWIDDLRDMGPAGVLARAGCRPTKRKGRVGPCPACGGPEVAVGRHVWTCFRCNASMDAVRTAFVLGGETWEGARAWAGLDSVPDGYRVPRVVPLRIPDAWWLPVWTGHYPGDPPVIDHGLVARRAANRADSVPMSPASRRLVRALLGAEALGIDVFNNAWEWAGVGP